MEMKIEHYIHKHPMIQYDLVEKEKLLPCLTCETPLELPQNYCPKCKYYLGAYCPAGCGNPINGVSSKVCSCKECSFYIHRSCADQWPEEINHPFHPLHPLKIHYRSRDSDYIMEYTCTTCKRTHALMAYHCADCSFGLCLDCASQFPPTKMEDGEHLLYLFENTTFDRHCNVCDQKGSHTFIFICVVPKCGYAVHFHCTPLAFPKTTVYDYHKHYPLTLTTYVEEDGSNEYYCDICELQRDPKHPVYYSEESGFTSHVYCSVIEVLPSLIAEYESKMKAEGRVSDPYLAKIDEELQLLGAKERQVQEKLLILIQDLKLLEDERDQYIATN